MLKKLLLLFFAIVIVSLFQSNKLCKGKVYPFVERYLSGQAYLQTKLNDYNNENSILVKNKSKMACSYNPPKMIMGISIVFLIMFFVISKSFYTEKIINEVVSV